MSALPFFSPLLLRDSFLLLRDVFLLSQDSFLFLRDLSLLPQDVFLLPRITIITLDVTSKFSRKFHPISLLYFSCPRHAIFISRRYAEISSLNFHFVQGTPHSNARRQPLPSPQGEGSGVGSVILLFRENNTDPTPAYGHPSPAGAGIGWRIGRLRSGLNEVKNTNWIISDL